MYTQIYIISINAQPVRIFQDVNVYSVKFTYHVYECLLYFVKKNILLYCNIIIDIISRLNLNIR